MEAAKNEERSTPTVTQPQPLMMHSLSPRKQRCDNVQTHTQKRQKNAQIDRFTFRNVQIIFLGNLNGQTTSESCVDPL